MYVVRGTSGRYHASIAKFGAWWFAGAEEAKSYVRNGHFQHAHDFPFDCCRGVALDMAARRYRFYTCERHAPAVGWLESVERALAASAGWHEWDVRCAWSRSDEFPDVIPEAAHVCRPRDHAPRPLAELPLEARDAGSYGGLLSVVDGGRVADFALREAPLPWLAHGDALLSAIGREDTVRLIGEGAIDSGAVVDRATRRILYWAPEAPRPVLAAVEAAWPGWKIERLRFGYAAHLAATGRAGEHLASDAAIRESFARGDHPFDENWLVDRRSLRPA
jgi:hypothetical protein